MPFFTSFSLGLRDSVAETLLQFLLLLVVGGAIGGCGSFGELAPRTEPDEGSSFVEFAAEGEESLVAPPTEGRGLAGMIRLEGPRPKGLVSPIDVEQSPISTGACPSDAKDLALGPGPEGGIPGVVVHVAQAVRTGLEGAEPMTLEVRGCRFHPPVLAVQVQRPIKVSNADPVLHTAHLRAGEGASRAGRSIQTLALAPGHPGLSFPNRREESIDVFSDQHPFMRAWIQVFSEGLFTTTDAQGRFEFPTLGPGTWTVRLWHPYLGSRKEVVVVPSDGPAVLYLTWGGQWPSAVSEASSSGL